MYNTILMSAVAGHLTNILSLCSCISSGILAYFALISLVKVGVRASPYNTTGSTIRIIALFLTPVAALVHCAGCLLSRALYDEIRAALSTLVYLH